MKDLKNIIEKNYVKAVSSKRLKTYIEAAEHDIFSGIKLYQKNITLSSNCLRFREGGQCLHQIYLYRPKGVSPKELFNDLLFILNFRNRIAHHESICFSKQKEFSTDSIRKFEEIVLRHLVWL